MFSTADDLTDLFFGAFCAGRKGPQQVRSAGQSDDDQDEHHHAPQVGYGHFVFAADFSPTVLSEFIASVSPAAAGRPCTASGGRAPPVIFG